MPTRPTFELGFVLAGAVSAGCYSAGVMDFIIEALDDYYATREEPDWDGPTHDVQVPVLAGASAGGMTAGMVGLHLFRELASVWPDQPAPAPATNRLYASWVTDVSIEKLLATTDLNGASTGLRSVLCSDALDTILDDAFKIAGEPKQRLWVGRGDDRTLRVMMTLTNLRGTPYSFQLVGPGAGDTFGMLNHADVVGFRLGVGAPPQGQSWLDVEENETPLWQTFRSAALATGAFPVGLAPRAITRPAADAWTGGTVGYVDKAGIFQVIGPDPAFPKTGDVTYWAVDGGTMNNEPLEQARRYLTQGNPEQSDGQSADRAVVLVAPFPRTVDVGGTDPVKGTLATALPGLASALVNQARFKPEELAQAHDPTNFARFAISPVRTRDDGTTPHYAIASGALSGFSGFLHESFRRHDYLLGRRNAQAFLRWNLALPKVHPLFAGAAIGDGWIVRDASRSTATLHPGADAGLDPKLFALTRDGGPTEIGYPIIPLTPKMQRPVEIGAADSPRPSRDILDPLRAPIRNRVGKAVGVLVDVDLLQATASLGRFIGPVVRQGAKMYGTEVAFNKITAAVGDALEALAGSFP